MKIAIVTGASSGMGREFVRQLADFVTVDEVWAIARRTDALEQLSAECPFPVRPISLDLCESASFDTFAALLEQERPDVTLLVNAAGFGKFGRFDKVNLVDECKMIELNCTALVKMTRLTLP